MFEFYAVVQPVLAEDIDALPILQEMFDEVSYAIENHYAYLKATHTPFGQSYLTHWLHKQGYSERLGDIAETLRAKNDAYNRQI